MSTQEATELESPEEQKLALDVSVTSPQACLREVVVTIPRGEVDRYMKKAFDELVPDAQIPGFRHGRAPRKLVEKQFKETIHERVKGSLVMDSLAKVTDGHGFSAIGEPQFDFDAVEIPDSGDFKFQFSIEVRPQFETPQWRGLNLSKPVESISDEDVDAAIDRLRMKNSTMEATDEAAVEGDRLLINAKFSHEGEFLSEFEEEFATLSGRVSFPDGACENFGEVMAGVMEGDVRTAKATISQGADVEALRGKEVDMEVTVVEVLHRNLPDMSAAFLEELGDFDSEAEFREFVLASLQRQARYREQQAVRKAVVDLLVDSSKFDLPVDLVRRQTQRELQRKILELRRSGFMDDQISGFVNAIRQNAQAETEVALREHFILEQIAEELSIEADASDYDSEIELIAQQSGEAPRKIRARLEKQGQMDALRNQIVEGKVIDAITAEAVVSERPLEKAKEQPSEAAMSHHIAPLKGAFIPEAMHDNESNPDATKSPSK